MYKRQVDVDSVDHVLVGTVRRRLLSVSDPYCRGRNLNRSFRVLQQSRPVAFLRATARFAECSFARKAAVLNALAWLPRRRVEQRFAWWPPRLHRDDATQVLRPAALNASSGP